MKSPIILSLFLLTIGCITCAFAQNTAPLGASKITYPSQPTQGPGGSEYLHGDVKMHDFAKKPDGYWLFEPIEPRPKTANVIVFNHGYGAYNPMIYGQWIRHLVRKGNIVIYPRYQRNLVTPKPKKFPKKAAQGIRDALAELQTGNYPQPILDNYSYIGHSYGGVISGYLTAKAAEFDLPQPKIVLMCSPGTSAFKGARLESYESLPADLKLIIVTSVHDDVVGDEFAQLVYKTATNTPQRNLVQQFPDRYGSRPISAGHNECYSLDMAFDTGVRNFTAKRALRISELNPLDYNGYWKLFDAALDCVQEGKHCTMALGNTATQKDLGTWSDGVPIRPLEVYLPKEGEE